ncbi:MAG TPA: PEP-CTERM sorting domain-containing protein [Candidatus Methylacidiphilales bacterium]
MKLIKLTTAVLALASTAILGTSSALAQANPGDLLIGFEETGSTNVYEVDLGAASQFISPTSSTLTFNLSLSDLQSTAFGFGSTWATNSAVQWGVVGGSQDIGDLTLGSTKLAANTLFVSWNTWAAAPAEHVSSVQAGIQNNIDGLYNDFNTQATITPGNTPTLQTGGTSTADPAGFAYQIKNDPNFGIAAGFASSPLDFNSDGTTSAPTAATLDLYELTPTNADTGAKATDLLGTFTLSNTGVLTFNEAIAAPEPSTWSLIGLGGFLLVWRLRRRSQKGSAA